MGILGQRIVCKFLEAMPWILALNASSGRCLYNLDYIHAAGNICVSNMPTSSVTVFAHLLNSPKLLVQKAQRIRKQTGDNRYFAPLEAQEKESLGKRVNNVVARPFKILFQEPMLIAISVYMSVS